MFALPTYRLYRLDGAGKISNAEWIEADADKEALRRASKLADGGRLGAALLDRGVARLVVGRKAGGAFGYLSIGDAGVPALPGFSRSRSFTF